MKPIKIAYLNILIALIFAAAIVFMDVNETTRNWMIASWFIISSVVSVIGAKCQK